jgi:hypothetical protein
MKKLLTVLTIGVVVIGFLIYKNILHESLVINDSEGFDRILIDSMKVDEINNIYWFKYNTGVHGYVGDYISVNNSSKQIDSVTSVLKSSYILKIDTIRDDSIFIYLSTLDYQMLNKSKYKLVFLTPSSYHDAYKRQLLINLDDSL